MGFPGREGEGRLVEDARVPQGAAAHHPWSRLSARFGSTSLANICQEPGRGQPFLLQKQKPTPKVLLDLINSFNIKFKCLKSSSNLGSSGKH